MLLLLLRRGVVFTLLAAGFVPKILEHTLAKRAACRLEPVGQHTNSEHVDVGRDYCDTEIFLHRRVLLVPVVDQGEIQGVITRRDFTRALADRDLSA
jgi:CBS domain-containing protein